MTDVMEDVGILRAPALELSGLSLCGVPWGAKAAAIPRHRVVEVTLSPIARGLLFDEENDKPKLYMDNQGDPIPVDKVVDSVIAEGDGVLHFAEHTSFGIERGVVTRFSLYGDALKHFREVTDWPALLNMFGRPDKLVETEANGDVMFGDAYYGRSAKWLRWDTRFNRLLFIALGGRPEDVVAGTFGSIVRRELSPTP